MGPRGSLVTLQVVDAAFGEDVVEADVDVGLGEDAFAGRGAGRVGAVRLDAVLVPSGQGLGDGEFAVAGELPDARPPAPAGRSGTP